MKFIFSKIIVLALVFSNDVHAQGGNYSSITFKNSVWSSNSYVGDLSDWVYFGDGKTKVVEYRAPESSFSISAAIRETEDGGNELESLVGATEIGSYFARCDGGRARPRGGICT